MTGREFVIEGPGIWWPCLDTSASSTRWQRDKEMNGVVSLHAGVFTEAALVIDRCEVLDVKESS